MKNKGFLLLTEQERNAKFKAALTTKTGGGLTRDEIQEILHVLPQISSMKFWSTKRRMSSVWVLPA